MNEQKKPYGDKIYSTGKKLSLDQMISKDYHEFLFLFLKAAALTLPLNRNYNSNITLKKRFIPISLHSTDFLEPNLKYYTTGSRTTQRRDLYDCHHSYTE